MNRLLQDFRGGYRLMLKSPGFSAVAILSLALGIGANSAIFSVVSAVLFRPLPVKDPQQLVSLYSGFGSNRTTYGLSPMSIMWISPRRRTSSPVS